MMSETDAGSSSGDGSGSSASSSAGSDSGSDSDRTTGEAACEGLEPESSGTVTLIVRNEGFDALYIDQFSCNPAIGVGRADGSPLLWQPSGCDAPTCEALLDGDCSVACGACVGSVLRLDPGEVVEQAWVGTVFESAQVDAACQPEGCNTGCEQEFAAEANTYVAQTSFVRECPYTDAALCECPEGQRVCSITSLDEVPEVTSIPRSVEFDYSGADLTVELSIG